MTIQPTKTDNAPDVDNLSVEWEPVANDDQPESLEDNFKAPENNRFSGVKDFFYSLWYRIKQFKDNGAAKWVPIVLCLILYTLLVFVMFQNASTAIRPGVVASLRYEYTPLPKEAVQSAKHALNSKNIYQNLTPSFWSVNPKMEVSTTYGKADTPVLLVDGDIQQVIKVTFVYGRYPSALENRGIALSKGLAWTVMGGLDIAGSQIEIEKIKYTVTGVFEGDENLMLMEVDAKDSLAKTFSGVELSGTINEVPSQAVEKFITDAGIEKEDFQVSSTLLPGVISALAWLPVITLCLWMTFYIFSLISKQGYWPKQIVRFILIMGAAILIPKALSMIPGWMVPSQWSDFEYWGKFIKEMNLRFTSMLSLKPNFTDVQITKLLIFQFACIVPCMMSLTYLIRRLRSSLKNDVSSSCQHIQVEIVDLPESHDVVLNNYDYQVEDTKTPDE